eukprot:221221_1
MFLSIILILFIITSLVQGNDVYFALDTPLTFDDLREGAAPYYTEWSFSSGWSVKLRSGKYAKGKIKTMNKEAMKRYISDGDLIYEAEFSLAEINKHVYKAIHRIDLAVGFLFLRNEEFRNKVIKEQTPRWLNALSVATHGEYRGLLWQNYKYETSIFFYISNLAKITESNKLGDHGTSTSCLKGIYYGSFSATEVYKRMQHEPPAQDGAAHVMFQLLLPPDFSVIAKTSIFASFGILALPPNNNMVDHGVILWDIPERYISKYTYSTWNPNTNQIHVTQMANTYVKVENEDWVNRAKLDLNEFKKHSRVWIKIKEWSDFRNRTNRYKKDFSYTDYHLVQFFKLWQTGKWYDKEKEEDVDCPDEYKFLEEWEVTFSEALFLNAYSDGTFSHAFWGLYHDSTYNHEDDILISVWDSIGKRPYRFVKFRLINCASSLRLYHGFSRASLVPSEWDRVKKQYAIEHQDHQWGCASYSALHRIAWTPMPNGQAGVVLTIDFSERNKITVTKYPHLHLVPIPGKISIHPSESEILLGNIPMELIELDYNHPKDTRPRTD